MRYLFKNYLLRTYYLNKIEHLFLLIFGFFLMFFLVNKTIGTLLYFQYFIVSNWDLAKIILFHLLGSIEGLFSFCATLAILIVTKQLSKTSEITSYFAQGISANFLFFSIARFAVILGLFSFFITAWVRPIFFEKAENLTRNIIQEAEFKFQPQELNAVGDYFFYFQEQKAGKFHDILLLQKEQPLKGQIISAQSGNIQSIVSENLFIFELENGEILTFSPDTNQQTKFSYFLQPVKITQTIQLQNIETRILEKKRKYNQYNFLELFQEFRNLKNNDPEKQKYYFTRWIFLITRSLHNIALPFWGLVLGLFFSRLYPRFIYLKFFFIYTLYYFLVIQLEESTLKQIIPVWSNFILPILTVILSYYFFRRKI